MTPFLRAGLATRLAAGIVAAGAIAAAPLAALAAEYPNQPITIIVPYAPGGSSDAIARRISQPLGEALGTTVIVDNKAGGNGAIGAAQLARAKADGHTILVGALGVLAINEGLYPNLSYLPRRDFDMLTIAVRTPNAFAVTPSLPVNTLPELLDHLKKKPGSVPIATSGSGSSEHLTLALFLQNSGTDAIHVPYKGGGPAITDTMAGHADVLVSNLGAISPHVKADRLRLITVTGAERNALFPDVPVPGEAGVPGMDVYSWQGIAAPKGLPDDVKARLTEALQTVLASADFQQQMAQLGFEVVGDDPASATAFQIAEADRWKQVIQDGDIRVD